MNIGFAGKFIVHKQKVKMRNGAPELDKDGNQILIGEPEKVAEFDNLITDGGLNRLGVDGAPFQYMYLSGDNSEPTTSDSVLSSFLGGSISYQGGGYGTSSVDTSPYYVSSYEIKRFEAGVGTGNISKIATGWGTATNPSGLWSSALVKDSLGNNTTITKLADEVLDITYEVRTYLPSSDFEGVINISGVSYNVTAKLSLLSQSWGSSDPNPKVGLVNAKLYSGDMADIKSLPTGTAEIVTINAAPYVDNSLEKVFIVTAQVHEANYASGIKSMLVDGGGTNFWQFGFSKVSDGKGIAKTSEHVLTMPPLKIKWGRYVAP